MINWRIVNQKTHEIRMYFKMSQNIHINSQYLHILLRFLCSRFDSCIFCFCLTLSCFIQVNLGQQRICFSLFRRFDYGKVSFISFSRTKFPTFSIPVDVGNINSILSALLTHNSIAYFSCHL